MSCLSRVSSSRTVALAATALLFTLPGCKSKPAAPSDAALANTVQSQLAGDSALSGQPVQASVQGGVVTLSGTAFNDAARTLAARDAAGVPGVKEVINKVAVTPAQATVTTQAPLPVPEPAPVATPARLKPSRDTTDTNPRPVPQARDGRIYTQSNNQPDQSRIPAPIERTQPAYNPPPAEPTPPPPPPRPAFRNVTIPAGATLNVRVTQTLDSATSQPGDSFSGVLTSDILADGTVALASGTTVNGSVTDVHEAGHFKGHSLLTVQLASVSRRGERLPVTSSPYTVEGKNRGANTAEKTGGGAAVGAILGGIFGGGKGAAIGAGAGAGVGAGANAVTRGQQVQIPSESVVRFTTTTPLTVRVRNDDSNATSNPTLQPR